jgi:hypothetical protein
MITRESCSVYTHAALQLVGGSHPGSPSRWEQIQRDRRLPPLVDLVGSCVMAGWPPKGPHRMITRGSCAVSTHAAVQLVGGSHPGLPSQWEQVESAISVSIWPCSAKPSFGALESRLYSPLLHYKARRISRIKSAGWTVMRYQALRSSPPGCGLSVTTITGLPWRRGSCLRADAVVLSSLWREGHSIASHNRHSSVEEVGSTLSHTLGISPWRGCAPHYPTHWASACGGDGHCIIPHIGHPLVEGMGTVSFHTSGRHCPDPDGSCVMAGCPPRVLTA